MASTPQAASLAEPAEPASQSRQSGTWPPLFNTNFLLASLLWGSVGTGYCIYGKKRGETIPLVGGLALIGLSYFVTSALLMSLLSVALIASMTWLLRNGY